MWRGVLGVGKSVFPVLLGWCRSRSLQVKSTYVGGWLCHCPLSDTNQVSNLPSFSLNFKKVYEVFIQLWVLSVGAVGLRGYGEEPMGGVGNC